MSHTVVWNSWFFVVIGALSLQSFYLFLPIIYWVRVSAALRELNAAFVFHLREGRAYWPSGAPGHSWWIGRQSEQIAEARKTSPTLCTVFKLFYSELQKAKYSKSVNRRHAMHPSVVRNVKWYTAQSCFIHSDVTQNYCYSRVIYENIKGSVVMLAENSHDNVNCMKR